MPKRYAVCLPAMWLTLNLSGESLAQVFVPGDMWIAGTVQETKALAVGDIDGDGTLDIALGNADGPASIYFNGPAGVSPLAVHLPWSSGGTTALVLGDIDGDGDLDLLRTTAGAQDELYLNDDGSFSTTPFWVSADTRRTIAAGMADLDGDGDLDLVCVSSFVFDTHAVYRNDGGLITEDPVWTSGVGAATSLALGDLDGNEKVDVVIGRTDENVLYMNLDLSGGVVAGPPAWVSAEVEWTVDMALGDIDGDGFLDLLCGNRNQPSSLYLSAGGVLPDSTSWTAGTSLATESVALGDIDDDGDLDVACGNLGEHNAIFRNDGGTLLALPLDVPDRSGDTRAIGLADLDLDGDLDVVSANYLGRSLATRNARGLMTRKRSWTCHTVGEYTSVTTVDLDGDGYRDVFATGGLGTRLFRNHGGTLDTLETWIGPPAIGVAPGDVDGDGDPDILVGADDTILLYPNTNGLPSVQPAWSRDDLGTSLLALGDVDGDGLLDLATGNAELDPDSGVIPRQDFVFPGNGVDFDTDPIWSSPTVEVTQTLRLADVEPDGDLDLLVGNRFGEVGLFRNDGGVFTEQRIWASGPATFPFIDVGDVNGDGWPDLPVGDGGAPSVLYLGNGETFGTTPVWSALADAHAQDLTLLDADSDGDLDLATVAGFVPARIYENVGGTLLVDPSWEADVESVLTLSFGVAAADIDLDGDVDLLEANSNAYGLVALHDGLTQPAYRGDATAPTNQLPNSPADVRHVRVSRTGNTVHMIVDLVDIEADPAWIVVDYQYRGEPIWRQPLPGSLAYDAVSEPGSRLGPMGTRPAGREHTLTWDVTGLPFDPRGVVIRLRASAPGRRVSGMQRQSIYLTELARGAPERPEIAIGAASLAFPTVTVGDTVSVIVPLRNAGNVPLEIETLTLPSDEMRLVAALPLSVAPGGEEVLEVLLEALTPSEAPGTMTLTSSDPLTPSIDIPVTLDVRDLSVATRLLPLPGEIEPGEQLTVIVTPAPQVHVEVAALWFKDAAATTFERIAMFPSAGDFVAIIPGERVTERGIHYYVEVENSGVVRSDPVGGADDPFFAEPNAPTELTAFPQPGPDNAYLAGQPIEVLVQLEDGAVPVRGTLYYRRGGASGYDSTSVDFDVPVPGGVIPGEWVGATGVELWLKVATKDTTLTDPPLTPALRPIGLRVTVPRVEEPVGGAAEVYRMVSVPLDLGSGFTGTLEALLADEPEFGPYDPTRWRAFRYLPAETRYIEISEASPAGATVVRPGRAFWLIAARAGAFDTAPVSGLSIPSNTPFEVTVAPGWNQIASPYTFPVSWDSTLVDGMPSGEMDEVVQPPIGWDGAVVVTDVDVLEPFSGYWVENLTTTDVTLEIPPVAAVGPRPARHEPTSALAWSIVLGVTAGEARDPVTVVAASSGARDVWDPTDRTDPPPAPGRAVSLYVLNARWPRHSGAYAVDVRAPLPGSVARARAPGQGDPPAAPSAHVFFVDVLKSFEDDASGDHAVIRAGNLSSVPAAYDVVLVDRPLDRRLDLRTSQTYDAQIGRRGRVTNEEEARFVLFVGPGAREAAETWAAPPVRNHLSTSRPNPFSATTRVRVDVQARADATLAIFDQSGRLVRWLARGTHDPGRYDYVWDGRNARGLELPPGVYFYRLEIGDERYTRKAVRVR